MRIKPVAYRGSAGDGKPVVEFQQVEGEAWFQFRIPPPDLAEGLREGQAFRYRLAQEILASRFEPEEVEQLYRAYAQKVVAHLVWPWCLTGAQVDTQIAGICERGLDRLRKLAPSDCGGLAKGLEAAIRADVERERWAAKAARLLAEHRGSRREPEPVAQLGVNGVCLSWPIKATPEQQALVDQWAEIVERELARIQGRETPEGAVAAWNRRNPVGSEVELLLDGVESGDRWQGRTLSPAWASDGKVAVLLLENYDSPVLLAHVRRVDWSTRPGGSSWEE